MALAPHEQFMEALSAAVRFAVVFAVGRKHRYFGGGLALARFVESLRKTGEIICPILPTPRSFVLAGHEKCPARRTRGQEHNLTLPLPGGLHETVAQVGGRPT